AVAVQPVATDGEERLPHVERARVDRHAGDRDAEVAGDERPLRGAHDVLHGELSEPAHWRPRPARISRATARSSNGRVWAPTIWKVSWPLPAMTMVSPACAHASAPRMAVRRSASATQRLPA